MSIIYKLENYKLELDTILEKCEIYTKNEDNIAYFSKLNDIQNITNSYIADIIFIGKLFMEGNLSDHRKEVKESLDIMDKFIVSFKIFERQNS